MTLKKHWKKYVLIALFNLMLVHTLFYITYKRYDIVNLGQGGLEYIKLVENPLQPETISPPKARYRILTPLLVKGFSFLPDLNLEIAAELPPEKKTIFFHFLLFNCLALVLTSVLYMIYAEHIYGFSTPIAYLGSLLFLLSFHIVRSGFTGLVAPLTHFFIVILLICKHKGWWKSFVMLSILGVLQKESVILVVAIIWGIELVMAPEKGRTIKWLAALALPTSVYIGFQALFPVPVESMHSRNGFELAGQALQIFHPSLYTKGFILNSFVGFLPLYGFIGLHFSLKRDGYQSPYHPVYLLAPIILWWISVTIGVDQTNHGRVASFAFPVMLIYQLHILKASLAKWVTK